MRKIEFFGVGNRFFKNMAQKTFRESKMWNLKKTKMTTDKFCSVCGNCLPAAKISNEEREILLDDVKYFFY